MYKNKYKKAIELLEKGIKKNSSTFVKLFTGDPYAFAKSVHIFFRGIQSVHDMIFWDKVERFLRNLELTPDERQNLRKLFDEPSKEENMKRLLQYIDNIEAEQVIDFLAKATKAFASGDIPDRETYFRICYVLEHTLYEDLCFLQGHIHETNIAYNLNVQGLLSTGLMYTSTIDAVGDDSSGGQRYSFTPLARLVLTNAILDDEEVLTNHITEIDEPHTSIPFDEITEEDIDNLFKE